MEGKNRAVGVAEFQGEEPGWLSPRRMASRSKDNFSLDSPFIEQIVGRERRERLSQLAWCGGGCFDSRRRVNSTVMRLCLCMDESAAKSLCLKNGSQLLSYADARAALLVLQS